MKTDFVIKDAIYLIHGECELDLHNWYDFSELDYSISEQGEVALEW